MIRTRPATGSDAETLVGFQVALGRESEGLELDPPTVGRGVRAVLSDPAKGQYWVAEEDGRLVGCMLLIPEWSDWRCGTVLWIHSVYVAADARRRGVFRTLYSDLKRRVEESPDLLGLRLIADQRNQPAHKVYEALGMTRDHYHVYEWLKRRDA